MKIKFKIWRGTFLNVFYHFKEVGMDFQFSRKRRFTTCTLLHIEVRLPVLLCAVKTVVGDFRFYWMISPNVGQMKKIPT